jgi:hypothetical protein
MLWYTSQHFNDCFDRTAPVWRKNEDGLYARSEELKAGLRALSSLHNTVVDALSQLSREDSIGWDILRRAVALYPDVVQTYHHRQFPDILAILLLIQRAHLLAAMPPAEAGVIDDTSGRHRTEGRGAAMTNVSREIQSKMIDLLVEWAEQELQVGDPRSRMFTHLKALMPLDPAGHLVVAFDTYCRHVWLSRVKTETEDFKAHYSYNQASFARADPGEFYELFHGKSRGEMQTMLGRVDVSLGHISHPTFCLWHTAIRYLHQCARNNADAQLLCEKLIRRIYSESLPNIPEGWWNTTTLRQLNLDAALTFYLLGSIQEAQGLPMEAMDAYSKAVRMREILIHPDVWDPTLKSALEALASVSQGLGHEQNTPMRVDNDWLGCVLLCNPSAPVIV